MKYDDSVFTLINRICPDPFITTWNGKYFLTFTAGGHIEIISSPSLVGFEKKCSRHPVWTPPPGTAWSQALWAPELHALAGRWYIYFAAEHPQHGNASHRMYVLGGPPASRDPTSGPWEFLGPIRGMPDHWAIDGTVITLHNELYFVYSGWPMDNPHRSDLIQQLYIMRLADPLNAGSDSILISTPQHPWEFTHDGNGAHGINEGPQILQSPDGKWTGIGYSCAGSWTNQYKTAYLHWDGGDPLNPWSWRKCQEPLIQTRPNGGPWGPGHGCFMHVGNHTVYVYHATDGPNDGWNNRKPRVQKVMWRPDGPFMGSTVGKLINDTQLFNKFFHPDYEPPRTTTEGGGFRATVKQLAHKVLH